MALRSWWLAGRLDFNMLSVGHTKIFMKEELRPFLNLTRESVQKAKAVKLQVEASAGWLVVECVWRQAWARGQMARAVFGEMKSVNSEINKAVRRCRRRARRLNCGVCADGGAVVGGAAGGAGAAARLQVRAAHCCGGVEADGIPEGDAKLCGWQHCWW